MASKRRIRRRSCEGKFRYTDFAEAKRDAFRLTNEMHQEYHVYKCKFCKTASGPRIYHVGRMSAKQRALKIEQSGLS